MKRSDKLLIKHKGEMWETMTRRGALAHAIEERRRLERENAELRERLTDAYAERDAYREKLRLAIGAMEDAREMASQRD
jgi:hypothetical protein